MSNKILTAEEFLTKHNWTNDSAEMLREFAILHVQAALKAAAENATYSRNHWDGIYVEKESILSAYPLDKII